MNKRQREQAKTRALDTIASNVLMKSNGNAFKNWEEFRRWDKMGFRKQMIELSVNVALKKVEEIENEDLQ